MRNPRTGNVSKAGKNKIELILSRIRSGQYAPPAPLGRKEAQRRRRDAGTQQRQHWHDLVKQ